MKDKIFNTDYKLEEAIKYYNYVNPELWDEVTTIAEIKGFRHIPIFDGEKSSITWCNFCGGCFSYSHKTIKDVHQCADPDCGLIDCNIEIYKKEIRKRIERIKNARQKP